MEGVATLPSGEEEKGLRSSDEISPTVFMIGTFGKEPVRVLLNLGWNFVPDADDTLLYGIALEWTVNDKLVLGAEVFGNNDLKDEDYEDPLGASVGGGFSINDWLSISAGIGFDLSDSSELDDYYGTLGAVFGWGGGK